MPTLLDVYILYAYHSLMDVIWDPAKARSNLDKHGVSFADVETVFYDPFAISFEDRSAAGENRYVVVGMDGLSRIVVVVYAYRNTVIRLISARKATKSERAAYEAGVRFQ